MRQFLLSIFLVITTIMTIPQIVTCNPQLPINLGNFEKAMELYSEACKNPTDYNKLQYKNEYLIWKGGYYARDLYELPKPF